ncbi:MNIO family bufferin maturase [Roseateles sp. NT4]|uniref:MNIO family bufferin maturase n=1 Tax=Roseateles sp. NT4 TaxID=3453715 RepID=UPI003EF01209
MIAITPAPAGPCVGIGWRQPHYETLLAERPALGFIEVHSENFFADGGITLAVLEAGREAYELSLHGVGLALGSAAGLDEAHLERLARLAARMQPRWVSDHACFARVGSGLHAADLLPIPFNDESLALMVAHVQQVQERLGRPMLVENISAYVGWAGDTLAEPEFFNELTRRSGCGLLLDVNNLFVNARNDGHVAEAAAAQAMRWVDALRPGSVGEIHLAGHCEREDGLVIDDHGSRVRDEVWRVYAHAQQRLGPLPTLIEWDTAVPELGVLLAEAGRARALQP